MTLSCGCVDRIRETWSGACLGAGAHGAARTHRYTLWRRWDERPLLLAVMLNPSTADENVLDNTLRRVKGFAQQWNLGGFIVGNAFALRATNPRELLPDPVGAVGPENDEHLHALRFTFDTDVVVGWGSNLQHRALRFRRATLRELLGDARLLGHRRQRRPAAPALPRSHDAPLEVPMAVNAARPIDRARRWSFDNVRWAENVLRIWGLRARGHALHVILESAYFAGVMSERRLIASERRRMARLLGVED